MSSCGQWKRVGGFDGLKRLLSGGAPPAAAPAQGAAEGGERLFNVVATAAVAAATGQGEAEQSSHQSQAGGRAMASFIRAISANNPDVARQPSAPSETERDRRRRRQRQKRIEQDVRMRNMLDLRLKHFAQIRTATSLTSSNAAQSTLDGINDQFSWLGLLHQGNHGIRIRLAQHTATGALAAAKVVLKKPGLAGLLRVTVLGIRNFSGVVGVGDRTDPYVELALGAERRVTTTKSDAGGTVTFREALEFSKDAGDNILSVAVYDDNTVSKNGETQANEKLGSATVDLRAYDLIERRLDAIPEVHAAATPADTSGAVVSVDVYKRGLVVGQVLVVFELDSPAQRAAQEFQRPVNGVVAGRGAGSAQDKSWLVSRVRERAILSMLSQGREHPNIVHMYGSMQTPSCVIMFLEPVVSGSVAEQLAHKSRLPFHVYQIYLAQTVDALAFMHSRGVVHRDVCPQNLLLHHSGNLKITSFTHAKIVTVRTSTMVASRPDYRAPEILRGLPYARAVDW